MRSIERVAEGSFSIRGAVSGATFSVPASTAQHVRKKARLALRLDASMVQPSYRLIFGFRARKRRWWLVGGWSRGIKCRTARPAFDGDSFRGRGGVAMSSLDSSAELCAQIVLRVTLQSPMEVFPAVRYVGLQLGKRGSHEVEWSRVRWWGSFCREGHSGAVLARSLSSKGEMKGAHSGAKIL